MEVLLAYIRSRHLFDQNIRQLISQLPSSQTIQIRLTLPSSFTEGVHDLCMNTVGERVDGSLNAPTECSICYQPLTEPFRLRACGHEFHSHCAAEWFRRDPRCPLCRASVFPHTE